MKVEGNGHLAEKSNIQQNCTGEIPEVERQGYRLALGQWCKSTDHSNWKQISYAKKWL